MHSNPRPETPAPRAATPLRGAAALACLALAAPTLLAFNLPPSSTFLNQAAALIGWGGWLALLAAALPVSVWPRSGGLAALQSALVLLLLAALASPLWAGLPWSLALSSAGMIAAALLAAQMGAAMQRGGLAQPAFRAFCIGLVVAGVASSVIGIVQVFAPGWADGEWIARSYIEGRAVGNLRQPNHLSSLLLWSTVAALWLGEARAVRRWGSALLALLFIFVIVLSGSRTGALSVVLLAGWGLLDRRLSRFTRTLLLLAPLVYAAFWLGTSAWADHSHHVFGGETRFTTKGDISSSRYGIWADTLALIRMHPWAGVGFGEFNFAWTLTPFPGRPVAFFDHTHNLVLQFAVELGLPLAALVLALLVWALYSALRDALRARADADPAQAPLRRAAFVMVLLILVHSLLEYPLWYAYFLLPAAFAFGLGLATPGALPAGEAAAPPGRTRPLLIAAMLLMVGGLAAVADYARVVVIFAPAEGAPPLAQRIEDGRHSVLFAHHADYAAATTAEHPADVLKAFQRAPHYLLDARLLQAWAIALNEAGETQRARYIAQRLREFRNPQSEPFFAPCQAPPKRGAALPFQCLAPTRQFDFEDFR
ncbi:MAG: O-antigen ligase C-terminal domain-containing protein [Burkholderiales bacterium]|nr:O-antigen ligase C-terminal domain-containing protein [Burkholderiales bacterium]